MFLPKRHRPNPQSKHPPTSSTSPSPPKRPATPAEPRSRRRDRGCLRGRGMAVPVAHVLEVWARAGRMSTRTPARSINTPTPRTDTVIIWFRNFLHLKCSCFRWDSLYHVRRFITPLLETQRAVGCPPTTPRTRNHVTSRIFESGSFWYHGSAEPLRYQSDREPTDEYHARSQPAILERGRGLVGEARRRGRRVATLCKWSQNLPSQEARLEWPARWRAP